MRKGIASPKRIVYILTMRFLRFHSLIPYLIDASSRLSSRCSLSTPYHTAIVLLSSPNMANDNGRGKREDRHNINYLLNELNVSPRPPGGRVPPSLPSPHFSLGSSSSTAASSRGSKRNACPTCGHSFSQPADLRKHISTGTNSRLKFK